MNLGFGVSYKFPSSLFSLLFLLIPILLLFILHYDREIHLHLWLDNFHFGSAVMVIETLKITLRMLL